MTPEKGLALDRVSIELTNACGKACRFCYNASRPDGATRWDEDEVLAFVRDLVAHGVRAVSFGGGEPLDHPALLSILRALDGSVFRSFTTHGLGLDAVFEDVVAARPDKVHVSLHFPGHREELRRVVGQVRSLQRRGVRSGVNLLVRRSELEAATKASRALGRAGIGPDRITYLPMRGQDTPTPDEMAQVAGSPRFQSMSCLLGCGKSERFASVGWDKTASWCSYTTSRAPIRTLDWAGLSAALSPLGLAFCGGALPRAS